METLITSKVDNTDCGGSVHFITARTHDHQTDRLPYNSDNRQHLILHILMWPYSVVSFQLLDVDLCHSALDIIAEHTQRAVTTSAE